MVRKKKDEKTIFIQTLISPTKDSPLITLTGITEGEPTVVKFTKRRREKKDQKEREKKDRGEKKNINHYQPETHYRLPSQSMCSLPKEKENPKVIHTPQKLWLERKTAQKEKEKKKQH